MIPTLVIAEFSSFRPASPARNPPCSLWAHVLHDVPSGAARDPGRAPKQQAEGKNKVIVGVAGLGCALDV